MPNRVRILTVPEADRAKLERRAWDRGSPAKVAERARIVLLAADGLTGAQIAERVGCTEPTVIKGGGNTPRTSVKQPLPPWAPSSITGTTTPGPSPGPRTPTRSSPASTAPRLK
jgi:hypothetical protein